MVITSKTRSRKEGIRFFKCPRPIPAVNNRIICPKCGNDRYFHEIAEDVTITTQYIQNVDGSFTPQSDESNIMGEIKLFCSKCQTDLTEFHTQFVEMLF